MLDRRSRLSAFVSLSCFSVARATSKSADYIVPPKKTYGGVVGVGMTASCVYVLRFALRYAIVELSDFLNGVIQQGRFLGMDGFHMAVSGPRIAHLKAS